MAQLVAEVVGPHRFSAYRWLIPKQDHPSGWHYGLRRQTRSQGSLRVNMDTVDPPLRALVSALHARGVPTLPSCAGHHGRTPERVKQAAEDLSRQQDAIKTFGLEMVDVEDGSTYTILDPLWKSPSLGRLLQGVRSWEGVGFAGATFPPGTLRREGLPAVDHASVKIIPGSRADELQLWVQTPSAPLQAEVWSKLSDSILAYINGKD